MANIKYAYGLNNEYTLTLIITNQCNLHCEYCLYYEHVNNVNKYYLSPSTINNFMDVYFNDINSANPVNITISGGEPTLSPYFLDIVELCANKELIKYIFILTNGVNNPDIFLKSNDIIQKYNKTLVVCMSIHMSQLEKIKEYFSKINYLLDNNVNVNSKAVIDPNKLDENTLLYLQDNNIEISPLFGSDVTKLQNISNLSLYNLVKNKLLICYDDDNEEISSLYDLRIQKHNPFKGYYCTSSFQNITVDERGYAAASCFLADKYSCWSKSKLKHFNNVIKQYRRCPLDICNCYNQPIRYKDIKLLPYLINKQKEDIKSN